MERLSSSFPYHEPLSRDALFQPNKCSFPLSHFHHLQKVDNTDLTNSKWVVKVYLSHPKWEHFREKNKLIRYTYKTFLRALFRCRSYIPGGKQIARLFSQLAEEQVPDIFCYYFYSYIHEVLWLISRAICITGLDGGWCLPLQCSFKHLEKQDPSAAKQCATLCIFKHTLCNDLCWLIKCSH